MNSFSSGQLQQQLQQLEQDSFTGTVSISLTAPKPQEPESSIIIFRAGKLVFASSQLVSPSPQKLAVHIGTRVGSSIIDAAVKTVQAKVSNANSHQEMFAVLGRMRIIPPEQLLEVIQQDLILTLEFLLDKAGDLDTNTEIEFDLAYKDKPDGWSLSELENLLATRRQKWLKLAQSGINSVDVIPKVSPQGISTITNSAAKKHAQEWLNGSNSVDYIARQTSQDPLKLATDYANWVSQGWIYFGDVSPTVQSAKALVSEASEVSSSKRKELSTVLSVDDSPVVQAMLKRSLKGSYEVLLASNGMDALKVLNSKQKIDLVLLDVTMPDVDGIELCRTIRRFKKFQNLPIIMLTAKDGMFDKVKGKFAGSTEYLTKPVDQATLLATIGRYIPAVATV